MKLIAKNTVPLQMGHQIALLEARRYMLMTCALLFLIVLLVVIIIMMLPLKETEVRYVEFTTSHDNFFKVYPAELPLSQQKLFIRKAVRRYVRDLNIVDHMTEADRFRQIRVMTTPALYEEQKQTFMRVYEALEEGGMREVQIIYDQMISPEVHEIEFQTKDIRGSEEILNHWIAKVHYELPGNLKQSENEALMNPLGMKIKAYHLAKKEMKE